MKAKPFIFLLILWGMACSPMSNNATQNELGTNETNETETKNPPDNAVVMDILIGFYNVENLFDTENDPEKMDEDFLPNGRYRWTKVKYQHKLDQLALAISEMGHSNGRLPDILGLAEIENREVVEDLVNETVLRDYSYKVVHMHSPDQRGIDLAFIYNKDVFDYQDHSFARIAFPNEGAYKSRDILVMEGKIGGEKIYFLLNHWPSRREGRAASEGRRIAASRELLEVIDSLQAVSNYPNIVIMGDFNDDPDNKSLRDILGTEFQLSALDEGEFYNPMKRLHDPESRGSVWHNGKWNLFDQILLSEALMDTDGSIKYVARSADIFDADFLRVGFGRAKDAPRRAIFRGEFVPEGFSDHFPVYLKLSVGK